MWPHRRYYGVHGYRGAHFGAGFGGFFISIGIILLFIGMFIGLDWYGHVFSPMFFVGLGIIILSIIIMVISNRRMARMRSEIDLQGETSWNDQPQGNQGGVQQQPQPQRARVTKCTNCGGSVTNNYCSFCGSSY
jgi:uncharacterized membrane protein